MEYFSKAVSADPNDPDYRFNLAIALFKNGDSAGAARQLREELQRGPSDGEAKALLDSINRGGTPPPVNPSPTAASGNALLPPNQPHLPLERIKRNYDEASYRQIEMEIDNLARGAAGQKRWAHALCLSRGAWQRNCWRRTWRPRQKANFVLRSAQTITMRSAHAQLAIVLEKKGDLATARTEAQTSVRLQPNVDALLVLARLDLKQSQLQSAASEVDRALALQPTDETALTLKRDIAAKQTVSK